MTPNRPKCCGVRMWKSRYDYKCLKCNSRSPEMCSSTREEEGWTTNLAKLLGLGGPSTDPMDADM